jgi:hypothetical protein
MDDTKFVTTGEIRGLAVALRKLADACDEAADRLATKSQEKAESTNLKSTIRGFHLIVKFVNNLAGTSTTADAREAIKDVLAVAEKLETYRKSAKKRSNNKS